MYVRLGRVIAHSPVRRPSPRRKAVAKKKTVAPKAEPLSSNEILMRRMKAAGVQPDPDHTESEHYGQS